MSASIQKFINNMDTACRVWSLGYDQSNRWDIRDGGECDCSSLVIWALRSAGFDTGGATYTGNLSYNLTARGWKRLPPDLNTLQPGDILLNDNHHVCAVISGTGKNAIIAQASIDEHGHARGGASGDQTGAETNEKRAYVYWAGWDCILRFTGAESPAGPTPAPAEEKWYAGRKVFTLWQQKCGTYADGIISGQWRGNLKYTPNFDKTAMTFENNGASQLVRHIQRKVGVQADGFFGYATAGGVQSYLINNGYSVGPCGADHSFGSDSVKGLYQSLTDPGKNIWR